MLDRFQALSVFVAVAEQRSFAAAARALGLSAPAVTRAVAALERHLGVTLLHRSTRAVSLTQEGAAFLDPARRILGALREAEQVVQGGGAAPQGQLYVTAPVLFGRLHVLPAVAGLLERHPGLSVRMMLLDRNVRIVEEGIDVAVRIGPLADSTLQGLAIGSVRRVTVASPAYLAAHGRPATPADLARHAAIVSTAVRSANRWSFAEGEVAVTPRLSVNTLDAALAAAEAGLGLANLLSYQTVEGLAAGRLERVLVEAEPPPLPVTLLYERSRGAVPAVRAFLEAMRERSRGGAWT